MTSTERPANSAGLAVVQPLRGRAFDLPGDVLGQHEQHRRRHLPGHLAGVEGHQRRVGGHGGGAVEQVGVGALAAEGGQPLGQRAQLGRHLGGAGLGLLRRRGARSSSRSSDSRGSMPLARRRAA